MQCGRMLIRYGNWQDLIDSSGIIDYTYQSDSLLIPAQFLLLKNVDFCKGQCNSFIISEHESIFVIFLLEMKPHFVRVLPLTSLFCTATARKISFIKKRIDKLRGTRFWSIRWFGNALADDEPNLHSYFNSSQVVLLFLLCTRQNT